EAIALQVIVGHLADALDAQRFPAEILAAVPSAGGARHAPVRRRLTTRPLAPGVAFEGSLTKRLELQRQRLASFDRKAGGDADVVKNAGGVVETEQQRAHHRSRPVLVPAEPGHHA